MAELGSIILRRGTTAERLAFVPLKGEIIYDTESKQVFVGDGETYGGNTVFNNKITIDSDGYVKSGDNLAIIIADDGSAKSLRLPGGDKKDRPNPVAGSMRYNSNDRVMEMADGDEWFFLNKTILNGDVAEFYVSLDGHDDRRYGVQRGRSQGTAFRTINMAMRAAEDLINQNQESEFFVNGEQEILIKQVMVHVAPGIYEEQLPIKVPANVSIFGSGQRRTLVRPKAGEVSKSPWVKTRFWRETPDFPTGYFGYHYLTDPRSEWSTPRDNEVIDIFLCNDTNWFHDFTTDKHASFTFVLDPEGQIRTKSPYPHTGASFPKSSFEIAPYEVGFHGGMFADGFTGNQEFNVDSVAGNNLSMVASGFWREPGLPSAFYRDGIRYQANSLTAPSDAKSNATTLLSANRAFIQEETVQFVNDKYIFNYNKTKCKRDLQFILQASRYDTVLGTNYLGRIAALSYLRPNSAYVLSDQLQPTIGGLNYAKGQSNTSLTTDTPAQQTNTALFNDVIDVLENGIDNVDTLSFPATVYDEAKDWYKQILLANISFLQAETIAFINQKVLANAEPFNNSFVYDEAKCRRDVEFLINAVVFDVLFESNLASKQVANSYWVGITRQIPANQVKPHVAAFSFIKDLLPQIFSNIPFTPGEKKQDIIPQAILENPTVNDALTATAQGLITTVEEVIESGTNYAPLTVFPSFQKLLTNTPPAFKSALESKIAASDQLYSDTSSIITSTINFIDTTYASFSYDEDTCKRDVGLIIDAMVHDLTYGGQTQTVKAAYSYFETGSTVIANQETETIDAIIKARDLALSVVTNTPVTVTQSVVTQTTNSNNGEAGTDTTITSLFEIITNILTNYSSIKEAHELGLSNIAWIQDEVIAFTNETFQNFTYDIAKCERDNGIILDGVGMDVALGTNYNSVTNGLSYQRANASLVTASQKIATVQNIKYLKDSVLNFVTDSTVALSTAETRVVNAFDEVVDIIENGVVSTDTSADALVFPAPSVLPTTDANDAALQLQANKTFLRAETIAYINTTYPSLVYDQTKCSRDVGYIVDALTYDILYGGNSATRVNAESYFVGAAAQLPLGQRTQTVDSYNHLATVIAQVVQGTTVTATTGNTETQDTTNTNATTTEANQLTSLVQIIEDVITANTIAGMPAETLPNVTWADAEYQNAKTLIATDKARLITEATQFIADNFINFTYNETLCKRDTGYIVAGVLDDLFGGERRAVEAGRSYYRGVTQYGNSTIAIGAQLIQTLESNKYAKYLVKQVLSNQAPTQTYQAVSTQTINNAVTVLETVKNRADTLYDIVLNIMENGITVGPVALPKYDITVASTTPLAPELISTGLTMITAGNKSFVSTDWTVFGNLGYGALARNNARIELVSIFTYYCGYTYKAESGSEIRSLNGSSSNGIYGLGAEGRNPFEVPVRVTSLNENVFVAQADSSVPGDNQINDLQIVIKNAVDYNGDPAQLFNVMVAQVDHGAPTGVVSYEIGNFQGNTLNIKGSAQGLLDNLPDGNNITIRLLQEYNVDTDSDISDLLLGAALIYDNDPLQGYRILEVTPVISGTRFKIRTIPSLNHISLVVNPIATVGSTTITINPTTYTAETLVNRRIAHQGAIYRVTNFTGGNTLTIDAPLAAEMIADNSIRLSPAPGELGNIFKDFSVVKAGNHDMLDVGTGAYEDSNYPRELYGPPTRSPVQSQEVNETAPGRVFFVTNDQDGNFRVGDYFRVNQGDGSVSFSAAIALSNLDGLGFTRGVTINEFSADSEMVDVSDESVPTEQAVVNYINRRIGQDQNGSSVTGGPGPGVLMLDGSAAMTGNLDMNNNNINNLNTINVTNIDADSTDTDVLTINTSGIVNGSLVINGPTTTNNNVTINGETVMNGTLTTDKISTSSIDIETNFITTTETNTDLELRTNGTGHIILADDLDIIGDVTFTGNIVPTTVNQDIGSASLPIRDLYLGPNSIYINGTQALSENTDGDLQLMTKADQNLKFDTAGTGTIEFAQSTSFTNGLSANTLGVDNITLNGNTITINGNTINGTGSASAGTITLTPGFVVGQTGTVEIIGDLSISGSVSSSDVGLGNTIIDGNLNANGNVTLGDDSDDTVSFSGYVNTAIIPNTNNSRQMGTDLLRFSTLYNTAVDTRNLTVRNAGDIIVYNADATPAIKFSVDGATGDTVIKRDLDVTRNVDITGNVQIDGTLTVDSAVVINSASVSTNDPIITLGGATPLTADDNLDRGVEFRWFDGTAKTGFFGFDDSSGKFTFIPTATNTNNVFSGTKGTLDANVEWADILSKPDPVLTFTGDVTGTGTMTDVGSVSIALTVGDDSHTHDDRYYTEAESDALYVPLAGGTMTGELQLNARLDVGDGSGNDTEIRIYKKDNNVSDHIQFYNGTTRMGEIGVEDTTWLRINQETAKNIYTPRSLRVDGDITAVAGLRVGNSSLGTHNANGIEINSTNNEKMVLSGTTQPYIRWQESTTDKAYIQWRTGGYLQISNQEDDSQLRIKDNIDFSTDGTTFNRIFHDGYHPDADLATLATNANNINVDEKNDDVNYAVLFSASNGAGYQRPYIDTDNSHFKYNPSTHTLTVGTLSGNATTATTATNAVNVRIDNANGDYKYAVTFSDYNENGYRRQYRDTNATQFTYNPFNSELFVGTVNGDLTGDVTGDVTGDITTTSITTGAAATAGSITGNWTLTTGSRFEATYADVAEIYSTDGEYEPGTVVMFGGEQELTIAQGYATTKVAGVISDQYALLMNQEAQGQAVALKGRIPVKVIGKVNKGDFIVASNEPGVGIATDKYVGGAIIGKAIESKHTDGIDLVEVKI